MRLGAMEDNHDEIVKAIEELKSTLQGQLKHQEKQMITIMVELCAFMKSCNRSCQFFKIKGGNFIKWHFKNCI
jgi:hypothetical protein